MFLAGKQINYLKPSLKFRNKIIYFLTENNIIYTFIAEKQICFTFRLLIQRFFQIGKYGRNSTACRQTHVGLLVGCVIVGIKMTHWRLNFNLVT